MVKSSKAKMFLISGVSGVLLGLFTFFISAIIWSNSQLAYDYSYISLRPSYASIFMSMYVPSIALAAFAIVLMKRCPKIWENNRARLLCLYIYLICYVLTYVLVIFLPVLFIYGLFSFLISGVTFMSLPVMIVVAYLVTPWEMGMRKLAVIGLVLLLICCSGWASLLVALY